MNLKKISLLAALAIILSSCSSDSENILVDFPMDIISYDYPLGSENVQGQTPINIITSSTEKMNTIDPIIHYNSIILNDVQHTEENLKINLSEAEKADNYITIRGYKYELQQFHFHYHSEHSVNGTFGEMEIHFVNKSSTGAYAVLGVIVKNGSLNSSLQTLIENSPSEIGSNSFQDSFNLSSIMPTETNKYYSYSGSLTTPFLDLTPNEGPLTWFVFKNNISLTTEQLNAYKAKYAEPNFRVIQPLNNRVVYENN